MATEDDDDDAPPENDGAPPEADTVALRVLAEAAILRRLALEKRKAPAKDYEPLITWVEDHGLYASFSDGGFALFDADPGTWSAEDLEGVEWAAEELVILCWALGRCPPPVLFARTDAASILSALPSEGPVEPFSLAASLRPDLEVETLGALYETLANAGRLEAWARGIEADPSIATGDEELDELLQALTPEEREKGPIEVLRTLSTQLIADLFEPRSAHAAYAFEPSKLQKLDDEGLALFLATAQLRAEALIWLAEGDAWDVGDDA
jgi:hypothetical protein